MISSKPRILFVDDHEDTLDLVALILRESHYEVITASRFDDSLRIARSGDFQLFIFDVWLADGSGIDLCRQVREFDPSTPILFYSAAGFEIDKSLALSSGAQAYLNKPVEVQQLLQAVSALITVKPDSPSQADEHTQFSIVEPLVSTLL